MDPEKQREIAVMGGVAVHEQGLAHEFTPEEAAEAGRLGGLKVSADRAHMAEIGRVGGSRPKPRKSEKSEKRKIKLLPP